MPKMLTIEQLKQHSERVSVLRLMSQAAGEDVSLRWRLIGREEWVGLNPSNPPGSATWIDRQAILALPKEEQDEAWRTALVEFAERADTWFWALPAEVRARREQQARDALYAAVAVASLEPKLTLEQARGLGPDAEELAYEILRASGILPPVTAQAAPAQAAAEAPDAAAPAGLRAA